MSRVLIVYRQRLGDIVGCLPAARYLWQQGHQIDFCCFPQYHSIFKAVSYCQPVGVEALQQQKDYSRVYHLEITRSEYDTYRASGRRWRDYVYAKHPDLQPAHQDLPHFDHLADIGVYQLPKGYALAAPMGISQVPSVDQDWFRDQCLAINPGPWHILTDRPLPLRSRWGTAVQAKSLDHLPALIAHAGTFVTINSSPNIIAAGVRQSWHLVYEAGFGGQSNYEASGQTILHQPPELARYSWRFWVHYWRRRLSGLDTTNDFGKSP